MAEEYSRERYKWTDAEEEVLIECLLEMKARRGELEKPFPKKVLMKIVTSIHQRTGRSPDPKNITNKIKVWRGKYTEVKQLLNMSGFGWDDVTKMVTAGEEQWNGLKNTKFYKYKNISVKNFHELVQLVSDDVADGSLAMSGGERSEANLVITEKEIVESTYRNVSHGGLDDIDEGNIPQADAGASQPSVPDAEEYSRERYKWTEAEEEVLIECLLEMKAKRRELEKPFPKEVLKEIITSIQQRTGRSPGPENITNKMKVWRGKYTEVKQLLNMSGFCWDDVTKMVTADEEQWNKLKNTKLYKYRNISVKNFHELGQLVSDDVADGSFAMSGGERSEVNLEIIKKEVVESAIGSASHSGLDDMDEGNIAQADVGALQLFVPEEEYARERYKWTDAEEEVLIKCLLEMKARRRELEKPFPKEVLTKIVTSIQQRTGRSPDPKNITNKIKVWRCRYTEVKQLLNMSGFCWDDVTKMVIASEEQWNGLKNTKFYKYRNISVKNFCELAQLVSDDVADGSLAMSGGERSELNLAITEKEFVKSTYGNASRGGLEDMDEGNIPQANVGALQPFIPEEEYARERYKWTDAEEEVLIECLLGMKARRRELEKPFPKEVLMEIITSIQQRTGRSPDPKNITNKIKVWRGRYTEVKQLLKMSGFGWDNVTKMVTAGEERWNGLKNTKFYKYRNISVKYFCELAQLVSDDVVDGSLAMSGGERSEVNLAITEKEFVDSTYGNASRGWLEDMDEGNIPQADVGALQPFIPEEEYARERYKWTDAEEEVLIECLLEMKARRRELDKPFPKEVLTEIVTSIQQRTGRSPDPKNITNKIKVWRGKYTEVKQLLKMSGFGWDDVTKMVTAGEERWNGLKNTKFYKYKNISVKNFRELAQFVSDDVVDGLLAMSGGERSEAISDITKEEFVESTYEKASHGSLDDIDEGNIPQADVGALQPPVPTTTTISARNRGGRKRRRSDGEEIKKTLGDIASAIHALIERVPESLTSLFNRVSTCVMSLPYVPEELKFDVVDFICEDEKMASRFLGINDEMKKRWLDKHFHLS